MKTRKPLPEGARRRLARYLDVTGTPIASATLGLHWSTLVRAARGEELNTRPRAQLLAASQAGALAPPSWATERTS